MLSFFIGRLKVCAEHRARVLCVIIKPGLRAEVVRSPATNDRARTEMSHLEVFTWYDFNATSQHGWSWATFYPDHLQDWIDAWHEYQMPGMWDLQYFSFGGKRFWNRSCHADDSWDCGLRPGWEAALAPALEQLEPYIDKGALRGIFLGDEPMLVGISPQTAVATSYALGWVQRQRSTGMMCAGPSTMPRRSVRPQARAQSRSCRTNSKVPVAGLGELRPVRGPDQGHVSLSVVFVGGTPAAKAQRYFADHYIKLPTTSVVLVPGIFGNARRDQRLPGRQAAIPVKQQDDKVAGFNPWH